MLEGQGSISPFPAVDLGFSGRRLSRTLFATSLGVVLASFGAQLLFGHESNDIGLLRSIWLGVAAMWLVVLLALHKRHNVAKAAVYLVVAGGLVCAYWDYLTNWPGWSLTYAVPSLSACATIAVLITVHLMRTDVAEHILYSGLLVLLGLAPLVVLVAGWVENPWPSVACVIISLVLLVHLVRTRGADARHELAKRLHV
jgi:peptidoglycan/LPS O-acetylase OafA/YrhL